jgi:hypothetical protein
LACRNVGLCSKEEENVDSKSVPAASLTGQNEPPVPIGSHTQQTEPIADKNRITSLALKRAGYVGLRKDRGELVRVLWSENHTPPFLGLVQ